MFFFPIHIHNAVYRARRNMAHLVSVLRSWRIVPGPHSSQSASPILCTSVFPANDRCRFPVLAQTPDSRIQGVSDIHKLSRCASPALLSVLMHFALVTIYGLISCADTALLSHENQQRLTENDVRREARIDLARRGLVATESQIMKWKDEHKR
jgi:hypothetical protein